MQLDTIQQDIATLPPEAQQIIFDLVSILKKRHIPPKIDNPNEKALEQNPNQDDWSDFIGCIEAEPDLSRNKSSFLEAASEFVGCLEGGSRDLVTNNSDLAPFQ